MNKHHNHNLNIHYTAPQKYWDRLAELYKEMPGWTANDISGQWYGTEADGWVIEVSVEPSGLQFYAEMPQQEWDEWLALFKKKATEIMGYEVGEPEDGIDFVYFD